MKKRLFAVFMAALMVFTSIHPMIAYADGEDQHIYSWYSPKERTTFLIEQEENGEVFSLCLYEVQREDKRFIARADNIDGTVYLTQNNVRQKVIDSGTGLYRARSRSWETWNWTYSYYSQNDLNFAVNVLAIMLGAMLRLVPGVALSLAVAVKQKNIEAAWFTKKTRYKVNKSEEKMKQETYIYTYSDSGRRHLIDTQWDERYVPWE